MSIRSFNKYICILIIAISLFACQERPQKSRHIIDLSGQWEFALDPDNVGIQQKWHLSDLDDVIDLPGTTDLSQKGFINRDTTTLHLNRLFKYEGPAWYRKKIVVPKEIQNKRIQLIMERTKPSRVWVDEHFVGESFLLQSPQCFDVSNYLSPGEHFISIRINNDLKLTPYGNVHIYTDDTQTNWNGIIGDFILEAAPKTYITDLQIFPDINSKKINIQLAIVNGLNLKDISVKLQVIRTFNSEKKKLEIIRQTVSCDSVIHLEYSLQDDMKLWDDYQQPLYQLTATINNNKIHDSKSASFGMRKFEAVGTQFAINGRTTFLRGKNDACVFPLTGHPPMDMDSWMRVLKLHDPMA